MQKNLAGFTECLRRRWTSAVVALVFALVPVLAVGQQSGKSDRGCKVHGIVLENQRPAADASVTIEREDGSADSQSRNEVKTDATGAFAFSGLRAGPYWLVARKAGLGSAQVKVILAPSEGPQSVE
ncbi:MAG: carboxypeptidase-like regulatory domain-containing protein, partial [Bradyrhizobium sp.]